jgi:mercuric ion transport protein
MNRSAAESVPTNPAECRAERSRGASAGLLTAGGLLGGLAAISCCVLPLALFGVGVSGAWIGNLTALAPYQPWIAGATLALLGAGFWTVYRPRAVGGACRTGSRRLTRVGLWAAAAMVAAALSFPYVTPYFLGA